MDSSPDRSFDVYEGPVLQCWYRLINCTQAASHRLRLRRPNEPVTTIAVCPDHRRMFLILGPRSGVTVLAESEVT